MAKQTIRVGRQDVEAFAAWLERRALITINRKDKSDLELAAATLRLALIHAEQAFAVELDN
jgi:hypothetical protein